MDWVAGGEQVEIVKKGKVIALLSPAPQLKPGKIKIPDFEARRKLIFGESHGPLPPSIVAEERESYEW